MEPGKTSERTKAFDLGSQQQSQERTAEPCLPSRPWSRPRVAWEARSAESSVHPGPGKNPLEDQGVERKLISYMWEISQQGCCTICWDSLFNLFIPALHAWTGLTIGLGSANQAKIIRALNALALNVGNSWTPSRVSVWRFFFVQRLCVELIWCDLHQVLNSW